MSFLVIGQNRWGHAADVQTAKNNFGAQGGILSNGYTLVEFVEPLVFKGVDEMGRVHWNGNGEPKVTEVPPRKR